MNRVDVYNASAKRTALTERVVHFCIERLMPRMQTLDITVEFEKIEDAMGYMVSNEAYRPREFEITISTGMSDEDIISVICHEMVHVRQYARRELVQNVFSMKWYCGEYVDESSYEDYRDLPWEREAYGLQETLLQEYLDSQ